MALVNARRAPRGLYARAVKACGYVGITDVIFLIIYYIIAATTLAFYDVPAGAVRTAC